MNILVLKPCCIGDVLMTTPLVTTLRAAFPEAHIDYAVGQWSRPAVATNPDIDEVLSVADFGSPWWGRLGGTLAAAWMLRWRRYDIAFVPEGGWLSHLLVYLAGIPRRIGIGRWPLLLTQVVSNGEPDEHMVDVYLRMAEVAGLRRHIARELKYVPTQGSLEHAIKLINSHGFDRLPFRVALYPGGGVSPHTTLYHKRWPAERYALLADRMISRYGGGVILLGDESERELNFSVRNNIDHPVLDLTGRLDIDEIGAVMQMCDAVIANDTGPMHLSVAVGTPTVAIFGPTSARRFGPYGSRHRAVQANIWCGPCYRLGGPMKGCGAACVQRVTVADLVSVLEAQPADA
jgi:lipopolysaccharide heptosyltransferase II